MRDVVRLLHVGTELAVLVALGSWAGMQLDRRWRSAPWCLVAGAALGFAVGLYNLIRATSRE
jgi:F0F1-type ATP synthase assembly protein I